LSFAKLRRENCGETQWEGKYPLPVSSTKRYFKVQSVHGSSVYCTVPSAQYKLEHVRRYPKKIIFEGDSKTTNPVAAKSYKKPKMTSSWFYKCHPY
jgi:hypothetical protein